MSDASATENPFANVESKVADLGEYLRDAGFEEALRGELLATAYNGLLRRAQAKAKLNEKRNAQAALEKKREEKKIAQAETRRRKKSRVFHLKKEVISQAAGRVNVAV